MEMDEQNKMIKSLTMQFTSFEAEIAGLKEEKKKGEELQKKLNKAQIETRSYKQKIDDICTESLKYIEEISSLKKTIEDKDQQILQEKLKAKELVQSKQKEMDERDEINKVTSLSWNDVLSKKQKEIDDLYIEINKVKNTPQNEREEFLVKKFSNLEEEKDEIARTLEIQNGKLITLADAYKELKASNEDMKKDYEFKSQLAYNKQLELQTFNQLTSDEMARLKKINKETGEKLGEALSFIKTLQSNKEALIEELETYKQESASTIEKLKSKVGMSSTSCIGLEQVKELTTDCLMNLYRLEQSLSFNEMIEKSLMNFNQIAQSAFDSIKSSGSVSIFQENIKDIYFRLYRLANPTNDNLTGSNIKKDLLHSIAEKIFNSNSIAILEKNLVEDYMSKIALLGLDKEVLGEIKELYDSKVKTYQQTSLHSLKTLVEKCSNTIQHNTVIINKKERFDYKNFYSSKIYVMEGKLTIDNMDLSETNSNYLINLIKYTPQTIHTVQFMGNFLKSQISKKTIKKVLFTLMTYGNKIEHFILKDSQLPRNLINYIAFTIEHMKMLKSIKFASVIITNDDIKTLCESLKSNRTCIELSLIDSCISSESGFYIAECLSSNKTIKILNVPDNKLNDEGLRAIFNVIGESHSTIEEIDLSNNDFREEDFNSISSFLSRNPPLKSIALRENILNMSSSVLLGSALTKAKQLCRIDMTNMNVNFDFTPVLFAKINFDELILDDNPLDEIGHIMLAKALMGNTTIRVLSLKNTKISAFGLTHLLNSLKKNVNIAELHLENNLLDDNALVIMGSFAKDKACKIFISKEYINITKASALFDKTKNVIIR